MKIDIGCGINKAEGFIGVDAYAMPSVDIVHDVRTPWPWKDETVEEVRSSHFIEHLTGVERVFFWNELYRVMKPGAKATIITPHWCSARAYGDYTHQWPPVSEFSFYYLSSEWRKTQAPHTDVQYDKNGYKCNFEATWGYNLHQSLHTRNNDYQSMALSNYKEAAQDIIATLTKR